MAQADLSSPLNALVALLEAEVEALRRFDFSDLDAIAMRKADLLDALMAAQPPDPKALERLRASAWRNGILLQAAGRGIRSARRRLAELRRASAPETYDALGHRNGLGPATGMIERRA
jgi:flagellar biosynthesis/type III secretory pathway chaperone